jgi:RNA polymerase sigma-70 factor, ECF subfamily
MDDNEALAERFEEDRGRLRAVAYRMLGSLSEADDAVQEAWLRLSRSGTDGVENLRAWLTTVVSRVCLNMLRSRKARREDPLDGRLPDPIVSVDGIDPEQEALLADSVGLALLVVLETLAPAERLAFVLHDMFAVPFDDIAPIVERSPAAARQLASRARRRVRDAVPVRDTDPAREREIAEAFLAASRAGDFEALVAVLDPDVVLTSDFGHQRRPTLLRGAEVVAGQALMFSRYARSSRPVLVNGTVGLIAVPNGKVASVMAFTIQAEKITRIYVLADPGRLRRLAPPLAGPRAREEELRSR